MTAQAIADLATQYSHLTVFSDDTIQSGENMLLTFRSIGKDVFPTATHSMLELAQVMGGDMQGAAVMLGDGFFQADIDICSEAGRLLTRLFPACTL